MSKPFETIEELGSELVVSVTNSIIHAVTPAEHQNHEHYWVMTSIEVEYLRELFPDIDERTKEVFYVAQHKVNPFMLEKMYGFNLKPLKAKVRENIKRFLAERAEFRENFVASCG